MGGRRGRTGEIETDDVGAENGTTGERNQHPQGQSVAGSLDNTCLNCLRNLCGKHGHSSEYNAYTFTDCVRLYVAYIHIQLHPTVQGTIVRCILHLHLALCHAMLGKFMYRL